MKRKQAMILAMTVLTSLTAPALVSSGAATVQADTGMDAAAGGIVEAHLDAWRHRGHTVATDVLGDRAVLRHGAQGLEFFT